MTYELWWYNTKNKYTNCCILWFNLNHNSAGIVYPVNAEDTKNCCSSLERQYSLPPIYCYAGNDKSVLNVFQTITVSTIIYKIIKLFFENLWMDINNINNLLYRWI